ncbi:MAG: glycosyltransferase [Bacteroidota bacterium]|nr:glycosyltransferase [Bacteroidota bacterium]
MTTSPDWIPALTASLPALLRMGWDLRLLSAWRRRPRPEGTLPPAGDRSASLILSVHDDLEALRRIWPMWRGQRFPDGWDVQWIVVDDGSTDGTADWLQDRLQQEDDELTVVHHAKERPGKQEALGAGIAAARHDRLVLTDADCLPGPAWAHSLASRLGGPDTPPHVLLGFSLPEGGPAWPQFDALRVAWQYGSLAAAGAPYMGVGRNLAYRKSDWMRIGGFGHHLDLASGDDDLFVQDAAGAGLACWPVAASGANAACPTQPASSSRDAFRRKTRHLTTAPHYRRRVRWTLATDALLDPLVAAIAVAGAAGLVHIGGWIPLVAAGLALTVRSATLSSFARDLDHPGSIALRAFGLGPLRWALLGLATLSTFTSSPTWTQRAPTNRS